jgi:hypothetical protein
VSGIRSCGCSHNNKYIPIGVLLQERYLLTWQCSRSCVFLGWVARRRRRKWRLPSVKSYCDRKPCPDLATSIRAYQMLISSKVRWAKLISVLLKRKDQATDGLRWAIESTAVSYFGAALRNPFNRTTKLTRRGGFARPQKSCSAGYSMYKQHCMTSLVILQLH